MVGNNVDGAMWLAEKGAREKTKAEAQALIDAEVQAAQAAWDAQTDEQKAEPMNTRPSDVILP
jgi:alpha-D-ribose 1-methylphosphonate 5-triphosphate synthase subunit PhnG